jgi:prepilin-type N-terminal cleavage/methylation domain-containing protein
MQMRKQLGYTMPELLMALGVIGAMSVPIFKAGDELHEVADARQEGIHQALADVRKNDCELRYGKPSCDARERAKNKQLAVAAAKAEGEQE